MCVCVCKNKGATHKRSPKCAATLLHAHPFAPAFKHALIQSISICIASTHCFAALLCCGVTLTLLQRFLLPALLSTFFPAFFHQLPQPFPHAHRGTSGRARYAALRRARLVWGAGSLSWPRTLACTICTCVCCAVELHRSTDGGGPIQRAVRIRH